MTKSRYGHGATHEATTTLNLKKNIIQPAFFASRTIKYAHTSLSKGNHQCFFILLARHFQQCVFHQYIGNSTYFNIPHCSRNPFLENKTMTSEAVINKEPNFGFTALINTAKIWSLKSSKIALEKQCFGCPLYLNDWTFVTLL